MKSNNSFYSASAHPKSKIQNPKSPLLVLLFTLLAALPPLAFAHAELLSASPAPGQQLATSPEEIRLVFNEPLGMGSTFLLMTADFTPITLPVYTPTDAPNTLLVDNVPDLAPHIYTVQWLIISSDGHNQTGSYQFRIGGSTMLTSIALAESAAFNPPAWVAWMMILLALGTPAAVRYWMMKK